MHTLNIDSPLGKLSLYEREGAIIALRFGPVAEAPGDGAPVLRQAARFLEMHEPDGIDLAQGAPCFDVLPGAGTRLPGHASGSPVVIATVIWVIRAFCDPQRTRMPLLPSYSACARTRPGGGANGTCNASGRRQ